MEPADRFYQLLAELRRGVGGPRCLGECTGRMRWPERGVYFFFEPGEGRSDFTTARVVRVGTHAVSRGSRTTLWSRLRAHRGNANGAGHHRGSIFRLHVGAASIRKSGDSLVFQSWGKGSSASPQIRASEALLEKMVSEHIGKMSVLWISVEDEAGPESDRAYLERNAIALLTGADSPSKNWLGSHSVREEIRESGLWNLDHVGGRCDPGLFDALERSVANTIQLHRTV